jgi:hypothetical protein
MRGFQNKKNNMRTQSKGFLALVILAVTAAAPASAIPIVFDIEAIVTSGNTGDYATGAVTPYDLLNGQAVTSQIVIDTDPFAAPVLVSTEAYDRITYSNIVGEALGISVSLNIGGVSMDVLPFEQDRGQVDFFDSHGPILGCGGACSSTTPDSWGIHTRSYNFGPGVVGTRAFSLIAGESSDPLVPGSGMSWLDFSQPVNLDLLLTLPTASDSFPLSLSLTDGIFDCTNGCRQTSSLSTFMRITSLTRTSTSVPEPGSLGLLAVGFAGVLLTRRHQRKIAGKSSCLSRAVSSAMS